jgi:hypothetical protein
MIPIQIDNATQVAITKAGLRRAIDYIPQWEGVTVKRNYQNDIWSRACSSQIL